jgi:predicted nucleic acid-binding Zn ribbon protein
MPTRTGKARRLTVEEVVPAEAWPCDQCGERDVVALLNDRRFEEAHGYCERCLGPAIKSHMEV